MRGPGGVIIEGLSLEEVAERVGYSEAANFTRAFRRWTGMTPAAFRRSRAQSL